MGCIHMPSFVQICDGHHFSVFIWHGMTHKHFWRELSNLYHDVVAKGRSWAGVQQARDEKEKEYKFNMHCESLAVD